MVQIMEILGLTIDRLSSITGVTDRTITNYRRKGSMVPEPIARLLRYALIDREILDYFEFSGHLKTEWSIAEYNKSAKQLVLPLQD